MIQVLANSAPLQGLQTGIGRYARNLYTHLAMTDRCRMRYTDGRGVCDTMPQPAAADNWIRATNALLRMPPLLVALWNAWCWTAYERALRRLTVGSRCQVYHETALTPAATGGRLPQVFTLQDLSLLTHADLHPRERVLFARMFLKRRLQQVDRVIVPSAYVRTQACDLLGIAPGRITAIADAPDPFFSPRPAQLVRRTRRRLQLPERYLLFVGTAEPRKNLTTLVAALARMTEPAALVVAGWEGWGQRDWHAGLAAGRVITTGYVDEETLAALYTGARAFVYPSLYEGFGLPVLEAMSCGCPVICSTASCLPETAGDAALLCAPRDVAAWADAMQQVMGDDALCRDLTQRGFAHAARFSWHETARQTLTVFEQAAAGRAI